jgi:TM2 domain-containing membrane protein YozV
MPVDKAWKTLDLGGGGLQEANRSLAGLLRRKRTAYLLWLLFPLGAHRFYLAHARGGLAYAGALLVLVAAGVAGWTAAAWVLAGALAAAALLDLRWIDRRVTALNKQLRMQAYLRPVPGAPPGFKGRLTDEEDEYAKRAPSFREQERLLAEIERAKREPR